MSKCKNKKCNLKCLKCELCEHYDKKIDFCQEKSIENVSKQINTDFSQCSDYLVNSKLIMF